MDEDGWIPCERFKGAYWKINIIDSCLDFRVPSHWDEVVTKQLVKYHEETAKMVADRIKGTMSDERK